jgi:hypothetical protein
MKGMSMVIFLRVLILISILVFVFGVKFPRVVIVSINHVSQSVSQIRRFVGLNRRRVALDPSVLSANTNPSAIPPTQRNAGTRAQGPT